MKKNKTILSLLSGVLAAGILAGCGGMDNNDPTEDVNNSDINDGVRDEGNNNN
ncbi:hypothetical protein K8O68_08255 [Salipaludibacillus sp. CUR1]|uniref:hypothetical protein n=1 Tax=Salipaludibacillus sp. CUR1 TaxID=2820003 RepID=UPI001E5C7E4E|nr:hypothetical protein [Salipaludibacillus sp. CUR1]MCE7792406.1 hypothetical protein [Salipaludibacillus sp. CUR1]